MLDGKNQLTIRIKVYFASHCAQIPNSSLPFYEKPTIKLSALPHLTSKSGAFDWKVAQ